jgi:hypothetical protein
MTQSYWPFAGIKATETQFSQYNRRLMMSGVWGDPGDQTLRVVAGVGLVLTLKAGYAFVRGHMYYNDADADVTIPTADTDPRVDLVVLRLNPTSNTITPVVIEGVPAASSPEEPTPVTTDAANYDIPLAAIAVAGGATSLIAGNITDRRIFAALQWGVWETQSRPGTDLNPGTPRKGQAGMNTQLGYPEFWDGDSWEPFTPTSINPSTLSSPVPITKGGTGSATAADARTALGITPANIGAQVAGSYAAAAHVHSAADITSGTLDSARLPTVPVSKGGTGATTADAALTALGGTTHGKAMFVATSLAEARAVLRFSLGTGQVSPQTNDIRFRDA